MASEVWYRKWRPQTFADVAGQRHVTLTLARAVAQHRVAHAYLFCGPRGTGKTSTARILAKAVNCEADEAGQPCTRCESCRAVAEGRALDLIEMDAASNRGIDEIRSLRDKVGFAPNSSRYKVYLIDEVHELTQFAFDALLKTLEEPPPHVIFILATTEAHKVPETILSRCQRFDFVRIKLEDVVARLRVICEGEGVTAEDGALEVIARRATGSLRDAVNLLEQTVASQGDVLTEETARAGIGLQGDARAAELAREVLVARLPEALNLIAAVRDDGVDLRQFTRDAVQQVRSLLLARAGAALSLGLGEEAQRELQEQAAAFSVARLLRVAQALARVDLRADPQSPLPLELAVVECIATPEVVVEEPSAPAPQQKVQQTDASVPGVPAAQRLRERIAPRGAPPAPLRPAARAAEPVESRPAPYAEPAIGPVAAANGNGVTGSVEGSRNAEGVPSSAHAAPEIVDAAPHLVTPASAADDGALSLAEARRRFRELYQYCAEIDRGAARLLNSGGCDIVETGPDEVVIGLQHPRMVEIATGQMYFKALQQAVAKVFGEQFSLRLVHAAGVPSRLQLLAAERPSHLLDEALKLGAKPVEQG